PREAAGHPGGVGNAVRNHARFARASTGQNQQRPIAVLHCFPLRGIELCLPGRFHYRVLCCSRVSRYASSAWVLTPRISWASATVTWATRGCSATATATTSVRYCSPCAL